MRLLNLLENALGAGSHALELSYQSSQTAAVEQVSLALLKLLVGQHGPSFIIGLVTVLAARRILNTRGHLGLKLDQTLPDFVENRLRFCQIKGRSWHALHICLELDKVPGNILQHFRHIPLLEHFLAEEQLVLVFEDEVALRHLLIRSFDQVDPQLFEGEHPWLPDHVQVRLSYLVKDELVLRRCACERQHRAPVVVSLLEQGVAGNSASLLVSRRRRQKVNARAHQQVLAAFLQMQRPEGPVAVVRGKQLSATVACTGQKIIVVEGLHTLNGRRYTHQADDLHV